MIQKKQNGEIAGEAVISPARRDNLYWSGVTIILAKAGHYYISSYPPLPYY